MASIEREVELALLNAVSAASITHTYTSERNAPRLLPNLVAKASLQNEILAPFSGVFDINASLTYSARADTSTRAGFDHEAQTIIQELYRDPALPDVMTGSSNLTVYKAAVTNEGQTIISTNRTWQRTIQLEINASPKQ